jgi:hypothetical protein
LWQNKVMHFGWPYLGQHLHCFTHLINCKTLYLSASQLRRIFSFICLGWLGIFLPSFHRVATRRFCCWWTGVCASYFSIFYPMFVQFCLYRNTVHIWCFCLTFFSIFRSVHGYHWLENILCLSKWRSLIFSCFYPMILFLPCKLEITYGVLVYLSRHLSLQGLGLFTQ